MREKTDRNYSMVPFLSHSCNIYHFWWNLVELPFQTYQPKRTVAHAMTFSEISPTLNKLWWWFLKELLTKRRSMIRFQLPKDGWISNPFHQAHQPRNVQVTQPLHHGWFSATKTRVIVEKWHGTGHGTSCSTLSLPGGVTGSSRGRRGSPPNFRRPPEQATR